jgi:adenylosuccinate synthase
VKAYTTRVGDGPFPTEQDNEVGEKLRNAGPIGEYGRTTGRPRRCGWLDTVVLRYAAMLNGLDYLAVTRLDILDDFASIPVCTSYRYNGSVLRSFPALLRVLSECEPVYEEMPGWMQPTTEVRELGDLPENARAYLDRLSELAGVPVGMVSVGPEREQTIMVEDVTIARRKR